MDRRATPPVRSTVFHKNVLSSLISPNSGGRSYCFQKQRGHGPVICKLYRSIPHHLPSRWVEKWTRYVTVYNHVTCLPMCHRELGPATVIRTTHMSSHLLWISFKLAHKIITVSFSFIGLDRLNRRDQQMIWSKHLQVCNSILAFSTLTDVLLSTHQSCLLLHRIAATTVTDQGTSMVMHVRILMVGVALSCRPHLLHLF